MYLSVPLALPALSTIYDKLTLKMGLDAGVNELGDRYGLGVFNGPMEMSQKGLEPKLSQAHANSIKIDGPYSNIWPHGNQTTSSPNSQRKRIFFEYYGNSRHNKNMCKEI